MLSIADRRRRALLRRPSPPSGHLRHPDSTGMESRSSSRAGYDTHGGPRAQYGGAHSSRARVCHASAGSGPQPNRAWPAGDSPRSSSAARRMGRSGACPGPGCRNPRPSGARHRPGCPAVARRISGLPGDHARDGTQPGDEIGPPGGGPRGHGAGVAGESLRRGKHHPADAGSSQGRATRHLYVRVSAGKHASGAVCAEGIDGRRAGSGHRSSRPGAHHQHRLGRSTQRPRRAHRAPRSGVVCHLDSGPTIPRGHCPGHSRHAA
jgi:hypothetical protein